MSKFKVGQRVTFQYVDETLTGIIRAVQLEPEKMCNIEVNGEMYYEAFEDLTPAPDATPAAVGAEDRHNFVIELANRDPEELYNQLLERLRAIDNRVPLSARLPGSPELIEQAEHLLEKYIALEARLTAAENAVEDANDQILVHQGTLGILLSWFSKREGFLPEDGFDYDTMLTLVKHDLDASHTVTLHAATRQPSAAEGDGE